MERTPKLAQATATEINQNDDGAKKQPLTLERLEAELTERAISMRLNVITNQLEGCDNFDKLIAELDSSLREKYTGVTLPRLELYISVIAAAHPCNPVLDKIKSDQWDGVERLPSVYKALHIDEDQLSRTLVEKWLIQAVMLLQNSDNNPIGAEFMLVLQGTQGCGKTRFARWLSDGLHFHEGGRISGKDKDDLRRCLESWIAELGELDGTFSRADAPLLKSTITAAFDEYRLPYGRHDVRRARHTSLIGTVNRCDFLTDPSGNRRYGVIPLENGIDFSYLEFSPWLLWREIMAKAKPMNFRLTADEMKELNERNSGFEQSLTAEDEIRDILQDAEAEGLCFEEMTVTQFKSFYGELAKYSTKSISAALDKIGIVQKKTKTGRFRNLPNPCKKYGRVAEG